MTSISGNNHRHDAIPHEIRTNPKCHHSLFHCLFAFTFDFTGNLLLDSIRRGENEEKRKLVQLYFWFFCLFGWKCRIVMQQQTRQICFGVCAIALINRIGSDRDRGSNFHFLLFHIQCSFAPFVRTQELKTQRNLLAEVHLHSYANECTSIRTHYTHSMFSFRCVSKRKTIISFSFGEIVSVIVQRFFPLLLLLFIRMIKINRSLHRRWLPKLLLPSARNHNRN